MTRYTLLYTAALTLTFAPYANAESPAQQNNIDRSELLGLAKKFVSNVGEGIEQSKKTQKARQNKKENTELSFIPDGSELLFRLKVGKQLYDSDILAIKEKHHMYMSLHDMIGVMELALRHDSEAGTVKGWFLREDWNFDLDINNMSLLARDQHYDLTDQDLKIIDGDVYINASSAEKWTGIQFRFDLPGQYVDVDSPWPLPTIARQSRRDRKNGGRYSENEALLPRYDNKLPLLDINTGTANLVTRFSKAGKKAKTIRSLSSSAALEGAVLYHEANVLANFEQYKGLKSVTGRIGRHSEAPELLGPLNATSYALGDVEPVRLPLLGSGARELGFTITNSPLTTTNFETTQILGDAIPGWDVELYRNGVLVETQLVNERAQYKFDDVPLFAGENIFEVFFYGPQGEIRSETVSLPVTKEMIAEQDGVYEVSTTLTERELYQKDAVSYEDDDDRNKLHVAAKYSKTFGDTLTYGALRTRQIDGNRLSAIGAGATHSWGGALFNLDVGIDQDLNFATTASARKKIDDWNMILSARAADEEYNVDGSGLGEAWQTSFNVQNTFRPTWGGSVTMGSLTSHGENNEGNGRTKSQLSLSSQFKRLNLSNTVRYDSGYSQGESLRDTFSARYRFDKWFLRGAATYDVKPVEQISSYALHAQYRHDEQVNTDASITHNPVSHFTQGRLNLNYRNSYFTTSPFVQYDSESNFYAGINLNFTAVDTPYQNLPEVTSRKLFGQGYVSAFVYHDKNGNMCYDEDDEALPDVIVQSLNIRKREETDEHGLALLDGLSTQKATDITVDVSTLPDTFMISGFEGVSVLSKPGEIIELEFPVHIAGEIDGTVTLKDSVGKNKNIQGNIQLISLDNTKREIITAGVAYDGFFVISRVPPGEYLMMVSPITAANNDAFNAGPKRITIGHDGDVIYGQEFDLKMADSGVSPTLVNTRFHNIGKYYVEQNYLYTLNVQEQSKSKLSNLLDLLTRKRAEKKDLFKDLIESDLIEDEKLYSFADNDPDKTYQRCQDMNRQGLSCSMDVVVLGVEENGKFRIASDKSVLSSLIEIKPASGKSDSRPLEPTIDNPHTMH